MITNEELINRYIYAATKNLPSKTRDDLKAELKTLIDDMLMERCSGMTPEEKDVRIVLMELGSPAELCAKYSGDENKCLIGSPYFSQYKTVLKIVLLCAGLGIFLATIMDLIFNGAANHIEGIISVVANMWQGLICAFAYVTIIFAVFHYKKINLNETSFLDNLEPVPADKQKISIAAPIVGIVFSVILLVFFVFFPEFICFMVEAGEEGFSVYPLFNTELLGKYIPLFVTLTVLALIKEIICIIERSYTKKVLIATLCTDIPSLVLYIIWLTRENLLSEEWYSFVNSELAESASAAALMSNFQILFLAVVIIAITLNLIETVAKSVFMKK